MNDFQANIDQLKNDQIKLAGTIHRLFNSTDGKVVMKLFKTETDKSSLSGNLFMDGEATVNPAEFVFIREGQNSVVRFIENTMKYFEGNK